MSPGWAICSITSINLTTTALAGVGARVARAIHIEGRLDDQRLAERVVTVEPLDRATVELALHIAVVAWWAARLGTTPPTLRLEPEVSSPTGRRSYRC